jgi:hypothetical protein
MRRWTSQSIVQERPTAAMIPETFSTAPDDQVAKASNALLYTVLSAVIALLLAFMLFACRCLRHRPPLSDQTTAIRFQLASRLPLQELVLS